MKKFILIVTLSLFCSIFALTEKEQELIKAILESDKSKVEQLIKEGVNLNTPNKDGVTPLMLAIFVSNKQIDQMLIKEGVNVNTQDKSGYTALMLASEEKYNKDMVKMLINAGADLNIKNKNGDTALDIAKKLNNNDIVNLLEEAKSK